MSVLSPTDITGLLEALKREMSPQVRNKLEAWKGTVVEVGAGANLGSVRVARGDEPTTAVDLLRNWYPVIGDMPAATDEVWAISWYGGGLVLTGGAGSGGAGSGLTGEIKMWPTSTAPTGYLFCVGGTQLIASYPDLAALLGTTYGGNGTTTFGLPDYRGRAPVGVGTGDAPGATAHTLAEKEGSETHALSLAEMPSHTHTGSTVSGGSHTHTVSGDTNNNTTQTGAGNRVTALASGATGAQQVTSTSDGAHSHGIPAAGSDGAHNNLQPSLGSNFIIKT